MFFSGPPTRHWLCILVPLQKTIIHRWDGYCKDTMCFAHLLLSGISIETVLIDEHVFLPDCQTTGSLISSHWDYGGDHLMTMSLFFDDYDLFCHSLGSHAYRDGDLICNLTFCWT